MIRFYFAFGKLRSSNSLRNCRLNDDRAWSLWRGEYLTVVDFSYPYFMRNGLIFYENSRWNNEDTSCVKLFNISLYQTNAIYIHHMWCVAHFVTIKKNLKKKKKKKKHGGVLLLVKLETEVCSFTESNIPPWLFFMFYKLCKWYQIPSKHLVCTAFT